MVENEIKETALESQKDGSEKHEKTLDVQSLIEKGKKGALSESDLDEMLEECDYDMDKFEKLYETLEDNEIPLPGDISRTMSLMTS